MCWRWNIKFCSKEDSSQTARCRIAKDFDETRRFSAGVVIAIIYFWYLWAPLNRRISYAWNPMVRPSPKWWSTSADRSDFTVPSLIPSTHLGIWACGSTWPNTGKHGSSAPHQRITQPTSLTAHGVAHLLVYGTSGSTGYETIPHALLETSGGVLSTVNMVVQRRDGPRRLRELDDDDKSRIRILWIKKLSSWILLNFKNAHWILFWNSIL